MSTKRYGKQTGRSVTHELPTPAGGVQLETFVPWKLVQRGFRKQIITPLGSPQEFLSEANREREARTAAQDTALMRAIGLAYHWQHLLNADRFSSMTEIAEAEGIDLGRASKVIRLAQLAPDLVEDFSQGRIKVSVSELLRNKLPQSWLAQRRAMEAISR